MSVGMPPPYVQSDTINLRGGQAELRPTMISEAMATLECIIPQEHHRTILGRKGSKVKDIQRLYNVTIKIPDRKTVENSGEVTMNGDPQFSGPGGGTNEKDIIIIKGRQENCEAVAKALKDCVPAIEAMTAPHDLHCLIIGKKGKDIRRMMDMYGVNIIIPPKQRESDVIKIKGPPANISKAKEALKERIEQLEMEKLDRLLKSFQLTFEVDPQYHPKIIGRNGAIISKIRKDYNVQIKFPERDSANDREITITGYENVAEAAKEAILKLVQEQENVFKEEVSKDSRVHTKIIDSRGSKEIMDLFKEGTYKEEVSIKYSVHSKIIGRRGRKLLEIMDMFKVDIRFPRSSDPDRNLVVIQGAKDDVLDAKDHLLNLEKEYMLNRFQLTFELDPPYHPNIIGRNREVISKIQKDHNVQIKFPEQNSANRVIIVAGYKKDAKSAKQAILKLVQEQKDLYKEEVSIDPRVHSLITGNQNCNPLRIMDLFKVVIRFPRSSDSGPDLVAIEGAKNDVLDAKDHLLNLEDEYLLRNHQLTVEVDPRYHPNIIGRIGEVISQIRKGHNVHIKFPEQNSTNDGVITITGNKTDAEAAMEAILKLVEKQEDVCKKEISIGSGVRSRTKGLKKRGRNVLNTVDTFKFDTRFSRLSGPDQDIDVIQGDLLDAKDHFMYFVDEFMKLD